MGRRREETGQQAHRRREAALTSRQPHGVVIPVRTGGARQSPLRTCAKPSANAPGGLCFSLPALSLGDCRTSALRAPGAAESTASAFRRDENGDPRMGDGWRCRPCPSTCSRQGPCAYWTQLRALADVCPVGQPVRRCERRGIRKFRRRSFHGTCNSPCEACTSGFPRRARGISQRTALMR
jgi:hypothetical protein